jgi:putative nucleotidyltransferase with HDIG domain
MERRMDTAEVEEVPDQIQASTGSGEDPVLAGLNRAALEYRAQRGDWERQVGELAETLLDTATQLRNTREVNRQLTQRSEEQQAQVEQERQKARRHQERARELAGLLKEIHRSLVGGNVYELILRACITITGATRGLYITSRERDRRLIVRAAIDVDGYPQSPPSEFIQALCRKVLDANDTFVCNDEGDSAGLPEPERPGEHFQNCIVAPVVLLKNFHGIVLIADKLNGRFNQDDVETLLSVGDQAAVAVENLHLQQELQKAYLSTVTMLANAIEAKDPYTGGHCDLVSRYARMIARKIGLPEQEQGIACYAALLHDVGKIGVSDGVLNKPGPLLPEERDLVRSHVRVGHDLIRNVPALQRVAEGVLHHHEWYDGSGYPDGLQGEQIPIASRIVGVVDAYCAMITRRSYKEAYLDEHAREQLRRCAGTQFDPRVVEAFLAVLDEPHLDDADEEDAVCGLFPGFAAPGHPRHAPLH